MKILKLIDFDQRQGVMMTSYGKPSSKKTSFGGTWPKRTLFVHTGEIGLKVLAGIDGIDVVDVPNSATAQAVFTELGKSQAIRDTYKSIVVDSLHCLREVQIREYAGEIDWAKITQFVLAQVNQLIPLMSAGVNILLISHETVKEVDGSRLKTVVVPSMGERTSQGIIGKCDIVGYHAIEPVATFDAATNKTTHDTQFVCYLRPHPRYYTRVRTRDYDRVPEKIIDPTFDKVMEIFRPTAAKPQPATKAPTPPKAKLPKRKTKGA